MFLIIKSCICFSGASAPFSSKKETFTVRGGKQVKAREEEEDDDVCVCVWTVDWREERERGEMGERKRREEREEQGREEQGREREIRREERETGDTERGEREARERETGDTEREERQQQQPFTTLIKKKYFLHILSGLFTKAYAYTLHTRVYV